MGTLQKLKAYFGMIPADEVDGYDDGYDDYDDGRGRQGRYDGFESRGELDGYPERRRTGDYRPEPDLAVAGRAGGRRGWSPAATPVRGALAYDTQPEPVTPLRPVADTPATDHPLSRITTLHLRSYNEARMIGEPYREGVPVIMNLTEMEDADARRLVDFAAGLAFALRGSMDRITTKVFLISPPNVDVTAEDKRRLAEGRFFARG